MRFDFFEQFYEKFGERLSRFGIAKEEAKEFYDVNCGQLLLKNKDAGYWDDMFVDSKTHQGYRSFEEHGLYIMPNDFKLDNGKMSLKFAEDREDWEKNDKTLFKKIAVADDNVMIETCNPRTGRYQTSIYFKSLGYCKENHITINNIDNIYQSLKYINLVPDLVVTIDNGNITVEADGKIVVNDSFELEKNEGFYKRTSAIADEFIKNYSKNFEPTIEENEQRTK